MMRYLTRRCVRRSWSNFAICARVGSWPHSSKYATSSYELFAANSSIGMPRYSRMPFCPSMKPTFDSMIGTPSSPGINFSIYDLSIVCLSARYRLLFLGGLFLRYNLLVEVRHRRSCSLEEIPLLEDGSQQLHSIPTLYEHDLSHLFLE